MRWWDGNRMIILLIIIKPLFASTQNVQIRSGAQHSQRLSLDPPSLPAVRKYVNKSKTVDFSKGVGTPLISVTYREYVVFWWNAKCNMHFDLFLFEIYTSCLSIFLQSSWMLCCTSWRWREVIFHNEKYFDACAKYFICNRVIQNDI